ncbi:2'-5' RNA ligase family protein [Microbacterium halotolerans]|uniref:2'-5' RNA ligase family protein n=1 Tax=Microbacterium halotolerans TaxID=246613 RepID=UPI000E6AD947|nr:2'-5' RNA ligase family protein [Microbacterium halotolerans]
MSESIHRFAGVTGALGIEVSELGCIMADVEPIPVTRYLASALPNPWGDLYVSPRREERFWIDGAVGETGAHVTLLYGLLQPGPVWREHVDVLLADVDLSTVTVDHVGVFDSPYEDERYKCIVAHLQLTPALRRAHTRLSYLPHVNTFPEYRAHVTLAYVKDEPAVGAVWGGLSIPELWAGYLDQDLAGRELRVSGINYGGRS